MYIYIYIYIYIYLYLYIIQFLETIWKHNNIKISQKYIDFSSRDQLLQFIAKSL